VLPGATRDRYRQEFLAELHGQGLARQLRHASAVLSRFWALRAAINTPPEATAADMEIVFPRRRRPLFCRLNPRHRGATLRTEDGKPYPRCQRCGKDETDIFGGTKSGREFDGSHPAREDTQGPSPVGPFIHSSLRARRGAQDRLERALIRHVRADLTDSSARPKRRTTSAHIDGSRARL
jgi:hypothetical protein